MGEKISPPFYIFFASIDLLSQRWITPDNARHTQAERKRRWIAGAIMDTKIKVLLANEPGSVRETLEELLQHQSDVEVVGTVREPIEILLAVDETQAEVVVLTLPESGEIPGICTHLLTEYPRLLILALAADRESACLYRRGIVVEPLPNVSEDGILGVIRRARTDIDT